MLIHGYYPTVHLLKSHVCLLKHVIKVYLDRCEFFWFVCSLLKNVGILNTLPNVDYLIHMNILNNIIYMHLILIQPSVPFIHEGCIEYYQIIFASITSLISVNQSADSNNIPLGQSASCWLDTILLVKVINRQGKLTKVRES